MLQSFYSQSFVLFIVFSGVAAMVKIGSRVVFQIALYNYSVSILLACLCGMAADFEFNTRWSFSHVESSLWYQVMMFAFVNFFGILQTLTVSVLALDYLMSQLQVIKYRYLYAHPLGTGAPVFTSFIGQKCQAFGHRRFGSEVSRLIH